MNQRYQKYTTSFSQSPSYLPKEFHYNSMNSIKSGKGYRITTTNYFATYLGKVLINKKVVDKKPVGVISGKCKQEECNGDVITLKMNTSRKGFETGSESVCSLCGTVYSLGFQILGTEKGINVDVGKWKDKYTGHDSWRRDMYNSQSNPETPQLDEGESAPILYEENKIWNKKELEQHTTIGSLPLHKNQFTSTKCKSKTRYAIKRAIKYTTSTKESTDENYLKYVDSVADQYLDMSALQIKKAKEIINNRGNLFKLKNYHVEDMIFCVCLYILSKNMDYRKFNALLGRTIRNPSVKFDLKTLYPTIREKLNNASIYVEYNKSLLD